MIRPSVNAITVLLPVEEISLVYFPTFINDSTLAVQSVLLKPALISEIWSGIFSLSVFDSVQKLSFINCARVIIFPHFPSKPIRQISSPVSFILEPMLIKNKPSLTLGLLVFQLTFIIPAIRTDESALAMWNTVLDITNVITSIGIDKFSPSMRHSIFPFSILTIYKTLLI